MTASTRNWNRKTSNKRRGRLFEQSTNTPAFNGNAGDPAFTRTMGKYPPAFSGIPACESSSSKN